MPHYTQAPITEALIDIRVKALSGVSSTDLASLQAREGSAYPKKKGLYSASLEVGDADEPGGGITTEATKSHRGWAFVSEDKLHVWQARTDGFSFSRLAPYESWEPFRDESRRLWSITKGVLKPEFVTRLAVRYINRIEFPLPLGDFKDYLRTVPEVAPGLPQGLSGFFMQLHIPQQDIRAGLVLNESLAEAKRPNSVAFILDIDISRTEEVPQSEEGLWEVFEQLHIKKNEVFEACITDRTREIIR